MAELKNAKQERFCQEYVIDYNGAAAASRAGYSEKRAAAQASVLLKQADVLNRVKELQAEQAARLGLSADRVIMELMDVYRCCREATPVMEWDADSHSYVESGEYRFDSKGAVAALKLIGEHIGMWNKKELHLSGMEGELSKLGELLEQRRARRGGT